MKEVEKLQPRAFTKFCMSIAQVPSSYIAGLTIEEQILWFCSYLEKNVIPAVNNNAEAVTEIQNLMIQLQEYVDNYFDNLDVQEEINNKLDEMAESGELADIIAAYLNSNAILSFDSISDLQASEMLNNGSFVKTYGKTSYNDGLGQFYKVRTITNEDVVDNLTIIALHDNTLVAELLPTNEINVKYFGATGDGETDDINAINKALNYAESKSIYNIYFPEGTYLISDQLIVFSNLNIYGIGANSILLAKSNFNDENDYKSMIRLKNPQMDESETNTRNISIKNLALNNNGITNAGRDGIIQFRGVRNAVIENLNITVNGDNCWGINLFSANQNVLVNKVVINNVSADNSLGGCLWIRSGLNCTVDGRKTKDVNITNCSFSTTTKDETVCIADGVDGGWTEAQFDNITVEGKAVTNLGNFLIVANTTTANGYIKANFNNVFITGKTGTYAFYVHDYTNTFTKVDFLANNINIDLSVGGGIQGGYNSPYIFNNCNIKLTENKRGAYGVTISNSFSNATLEACLVKNCYLDTGARNCCEDCRVVTNSVLRTTSKGIHTYGGQRLYIANNEIYADVNAIHLQNNNSNGAKDTIILGNYMQRLTENSNAGSIAINVPYIKNSNAAQNRYLLHGSDGSSLGFRYYEGASNASEYYRNDYATTV